MTEHGTESILPRPMFPGVTQGGLRQFNERMLLSTIRRLEQASGSVLARETGLSAQTVSIILRDLEGDGLLVRGDPQRGRVGKPSIPMALAADGAFSVGLKIGRRNAELVLMDLHGTIREQLRLTYRDALPDKVFGFLKEGLGHLTSGLPQNLRNRLCGIGIALPFEIWKWNESVEAPHEDFEAWRDTDFAHRVSAFSDLPVAVVNDGTAACRAERVFGRGHEFRDHAYFFVGTFIGGGIVMNNAVVEGRRGNAGALGSLRSLDAAGNSVQLVETASLHLLEAALVRGGADPAALWRQPQDWSALERFLSPWIEQAGPEIAKAAMSACAVIDFEAVLIDGAFPDTVRERLVAKVRATIETLDTRGLIRPRVEAGIVGGNAQVIGAAYGPISAQFFLNASTGISTS